MKLNKNTYSTAYSGCKLAQQRHNKVYIDKLRSLTALPVQHFDFFYLEPLKAFLAITQHCEDSHTHDHLQAVLAAIKLRRSFILPAGATSESNKDLWTYAVFVSALMYGLPALISKTVLCTDSLHSNKSLYKWCLFSGAIPEGHYYKVVDTIVITHLSALSLLPLLFNTSCLTWLCRDIIAVNSVMESIVSPTPNTPLGHIICKVYTAADGQSTKPTSKAKPEGKTDQVKAVEESTADDFYIWLVKMVAEKNDIVKAYSCQTLDGMAFRIPDIFQLYAKSNNINSEQVQKDFLASRHYTGSKKVAFPSLGKRSVIILKEPKP